MTSMSGSDWLPKLKIRDRIIALVVVPVVGLLALGFAYLFADSRIESAFDNNLKFQKILENAEKFEISVLEMRRREKDFLLLRGRDTALQERKDEAYLSQFKESANKALTALAAITDHAGLLGEIADEDIASIAAQLGADLQSYTGEFAETGEELDPTGFHEIVGILKSIGMRAGEGLDARLQQSANGVEQIISEANLDYLTMEMLLMRQDQMRFIESRNRQYLNSFQDRLNEFEGLLEDSDIDPVLLTRVYVMMANYQLSFESFAQQLLDLDVKTENLGRIFDRMEPSYRTIADAALIGLSTSEKNLTETREAMRLVWLILAVAIGALVVFFGGSISRSVIIPIRSITKLFGRIADGAADVDIPYQNQQDEIGEMANALAGFYGVSVSAMRAESAVMMASANVMITDTEHRILSLNRSAQSMFRRVEDELRSELAGFTADDLIGSNIDVFGQTWVRDGIFNHSTTGDGADGSPEDDRDAAHDNKPVRAVIGYRTFDIIFTPVLNRHDELIGTVCEWNDITTQLAVEQQIADIVQAASNGDFSQRLTEADKVGFMADLSNGMNELLDVVDHGLNQVIRVMSALAEGDITKRMQGEHKGAFAKLKTDADRMGDQMEDMVGRIVSVSNTVKAATDEISSGMSDLSARSEHQASSLEETTASMEELSATVRQNADNAHEANQIAAAARDAAISGGKVAARAVGAMDGIEGSSKKIGEIVGLIQEIAFQTNLLALNASVEAARAGEAGRGFAVVANEVRALAQRAASASKDIKELISNSGGQVQEGVKLVGEAGDSLEEIVKSVKKVADYVSEIASASQEQTSGIDQVSSAISGMDEMTQQNAALVEETTGAIASSITQVEYLQTAIGFFKTAHSRPSTISPSEASSEIADDPVPDQQPRLPARIGARKSAAGGAAVLDLDEDWQEF